MAWNMFVLLAISVVLLTRGVVSLPVPVAADLDPAVVAAAGARAAGDAAPDADADRLQNDEDEILEEDREEREEPDNEEEAEADDLNEFILDDEISYLPNQSKQILIKVQHSLPREERATHILESDFDEVKKKVSTMLIVAIVCGSIVIVFSFCTFAFMSVVFVVFCVYLMRKRQAAKTLSTAEMLLEQLSVGGDTASGKASGLFQNQETRDEKYNEIRAKYGIGTEQYPRVNTQISPSRQTLLH